MNNLQRAARFFIHRIDASMWSDAPYRNRALALIDKGIGGIGVFAGGLEETARMIEDVQRAAGGTLIVGADFEHGLAMRLHDAVAFPRAMALGRLDAARTKEVAGMIAEQARAIGVHWIWGPVCDIHSNPKNPIVATRAFGTDPELVSRHVQAWVKGCQDAGVIACAKHVPGHGDTLVDSHIALPAIHVSEHMAVEREFVPFRAAQQAGVLSCMIGHLLVPFLDDQLPASLSFNVVNGLVRQQWGYDGFVVSDALDMGAIDRTYASGDAAVMSFAAGVDGLLMPRSIEAAIMALAAAIEDGEIDDRRCADSERRWASLRSAVKSSGAQNGKIDSAGSALVALQAARDAMSVDGDARTFDVRQYKQAVMLAAIDETDAEIATTFFRYVAQSVETDIDFGFIDGTISSEDLSALAESIHDTSALYIVLVSRPMAGRAGVAGLDNLPNIVAALGAGRPVMTVVLGNNDGLPPISSRGAVTTFSDTDPSLAAAALLCAGRNAI